MTKEELKEYLPHREPMLLIEEAYIDENGIAHFKYLIKEDEFFTRGHQSSLLSTRCSSTPRATLISIIFRFVCDTRYSVF